MHLRKLDLNLLVALEALLSERNVTRAAERLHISQPGMSAALQKLRRHFGDKLLERVGRRLELTPRAKGLIEPLTDVLFQVDNLVQLEPTFDPLTAKRVFRVTMSDLCSELLGPPLIRSLTTLAPNIGCEIDDMMQDALMRLHEGQSDLLITLAQRTFLDPNYNDGSLEESLLFKDHMVLISARNNPLIHDDISYPEFCRMPYAEVRFGGHIVGIVESTLRRQKDKPMTRIWVPGFMQAMSLVSTSDLVTILPERLVDKYADVLSLKKAPAPLSFPEIEETMVWYKRNEDDPGHRWIRGMLEAAARSL